MHCRRAGVVLLLSLMLFVSLARAQDHVSFSGQAGISYGHSWLSGQEFKSFTPPPDACDCDTTLYSGSYVAPFVGVGAKFMGFMQGGVQLGIASTKVSWIVYRTDLPYLIDTLGNVGIATIEHTRRLKVFDIYTRLYAGPELPLGFTIEIGLNIVANGSNSASEEMRIVSNDTARFVGYPAEDLSPDARFVMLSDESVTNFPSIRFEVDAAIGKVFAFGDVDIHVQALYRHGLSNLHHARQMFTRALAGSVSVSYTL